MEIRNSDYHIDNELIDEIRISGESLENNLRYNFYSLSLNSDDYTLINKMPIFIKFMNIKKIIKNYLC